MPEEWFLTVEEVSGRLRVHPATVRRWIKAGKLKGRLLGGTKMGYRIAEEELERFLKQNNGKEEKPMT